MVFAEHREGFWRDGRHPSASVQEMLDEHRNILAALAKRRQRNAYYVQPVVQVFAKFPFLNRFFQITVARVALIFSALVLGQSSPLRPATRSSASPSLGTYDPRETVRAEVARGY